MSAPTQATSCCDAIVVDAADAALIDHGNEYFLKRPLLRLRLHALSCFFLTSQCFPWPWFRCSFVYRYCTSANCSLVGVLFAACVWSSDGYRVSGARLSSRALVVDISGWTRTHRGLLYLIISTNNTSRCPFVGKIGSRGRAGWRQTSPKKLLIRLFHSDLWKWVEISTNHLNSDRIIHQSPLSLI